MNVDMICAHYSKEELQELIVDLLAEVDVNIDIIDVVVSDILSNSVQGVFDLRDDYHFAVAERLLDVGDTLSYLMDYEESKG